MNFDDFLSRLEKVQRFGNDRAKACCPAHDDINPSLSLRKTAGNTVLIHCFAGCAPSDILAAIGLTMSDLYPNQPAQHHRKGIKPNHWHATREALKTLEQESLICAIAASDAAAGKPITKQDAARCLLAAQRIRTTVEVCK